ncbi:MAG: hypothetical protein J7621_08475 [Niastella sp.]|nr:hypothetical protein [Niastella sp.]
MNKTLLLVVSLLLLVCLNASAKIWRVNNIVGIAADFTTLQAAHDAATSGDTLHIEGSPNTYNSLQVTKKLIFIGPGYYLDENPNTQAFNQSAKLSSLDFRAGSSGSIVMGLDFNGGTLYVYTNDIVIRRNRFCSESGTTIDYSVGVISLNYNINIGTSAPVNNVIISENFGVRVDINYASTGVLISNNYLAWNGYGGDNTTGQCLVFQANAVVIVQNNIIRRGRITAYNSNFSNNIMIAGTFEGTGNLVSNNLSNAAQFGTTNGNQANVVMTNVFVGAGTGISSDGQWKLKAGSPAIGAGYGSTAQNPIDVGMYGGTTAYKLSGQPPVPAIYFMENQPIGSNSDPVDVTIKVKSVGN